MATMMTPGVYIVEKDAFPNSVVEVATAVPAFIGYTGKHLNKEQSLRYKPRKVTSLAEYALFFGGAPKLQGQFTISDGPPEALDDGREIAMTAGPMDPVVKEGGKAYYLARAEASRRYHMYYGLRSFYQNGGGPCYIVSVGSYEDKLDSGDFEKGIEALLREQEPTMVVMPDAVLLSAADCMSIQQAAISHCAKMQSRFAILDVFRGYLPRMAEGQRDCVADFRELATDDPKYCAAYYPWIDTTVVSGTDAELTYKAFDDAGVAALQELLTAELITDETPAAKKTLIENLIADASNPDAQTGTTNDGLLATSGNFQDLMKQMRAEVNRLPPSATMAGVYSRVDNSRGVWKAPANVALSGVVKPAVNITHDEQEDLNVTVTGKSVNAIRSFVGEGTLVWGARTLDGNSLDWRYIQVRRTMIMLEQSLKLASKAYVFEANDANTWVTMKSMIRNFLTGIWKRGGLAGASPEAAFSVHVGLGETMTSVDILEGIMRVTVLVAPTRPAEFIEITFQQKMQDSGGGG